MLRGLGMLTKQCPSCAHVLLNCLAYVAIVGYLEIDLAS